MTVVVMTREMGSLGKDVAREFARRKGFTVIHHELSRSAPDTNGRREESEVYRFLEGTEAEIDSWRSNRAPDGYLSPEEVLELALEGQVLIRGWGAARLLKPVPNILSVRVCAPMENRVETLSARLGIDARSARHAIERNDASHSRTFLRFFDSDWRDPLNYDLVLNTAHVDPMTCADILVDAAENQTFTETPEMRKALSDMLLRERIDTALRQDEVLGPRTRNVEVSVENLGVRLYGVVNDGQSGRIAERLVTERFDIAGLSNEIAQIGGFSS